MEIDEGPDPEPEPSAAADQEFIKDKEETEEDLRNEGDEDEQDQDLNFDTTDSADALSARGNCTKHENVDLTEEDDPNHYHEHEQEGDEDFEDEQQEQNDDMEEFIDEADFAFPDEDEASSSAPPSPKPVEDIVKKRVPDYIGDPIVSDEEESDVESLGPPDYDEEDSDSDQWDVRPRVEKAAEDEDRGDSDDEEDDDATAPMNIDRNAEDVETELVDQGDAHDKSRSQEAMEDEEDQEEDEDEEEEDSEDEDTKPNPELAAALHEEIIRRSKLPQEAGSVEQEPLRDTNPVIKTEKTPPASQSEDQSTSIKEEVVESELPLEQRVLMQEELRNYCFRELRSLQLSAYSECIDAFRAGGKLTSEKQDLMASLRNAFNIPIGRHRSEIRRALSCEKLAVIADNVTSGNSAENSANWTLEGYNNIVTDPRFLTYRLGRNDEEVRLVLEDANIEPEPSVFNKTYRGKDLPPRQCTVADTKTDIDWEEELEKYKDRIAVPSDVQLSVEVDNSSTEEEDEISQELETNMNSGRSRRSRTPTAAALAAKRGGKPTAKTKTLELQRGRQQQASPDITSPAALSPPKKTQKPSTSKGAGATKRKMSQAKSAGEKMRKVIKFQNAAVVKKAKVKAATARAKASTTAKEDGSSSTAAAGTSRAVALSLSRVFRGRGGRAGGRGRGGRGGQKSRLIRDNSLNSNSLETTEEMPASPQLVANTSKPKPKRKILKVKKPSAAAAQKQNQEQKSTMETVTKQRRKAKQEEIKDEGDYELEDSTTLSGRGRIRTPSPFTHYNNIMANASSSYPLATELPSKVRHKGKVGVQGTGSENYEHAELPRFNLNDEIQSHFSNALNRPTVSGINCNPQPPRTIYSSSPMPLPVFSTSLNMNNFHKKRTQLLLPSTYQDLGMPGASAVGNDENSSAEGQFMTASSLAASRVRNQPPAVLSAASLLFRQQATGFVMSGGNANPGTSASLPAASAGVSASQASGGGVGVGSAVRAQTPPILQRKATPHILSNSKLHRNANSVAVNSAYSNSTINANCNVTTTSPTGTTPSPANDQTASAFASASSNASSSSSSSGNNHLLSGESLEAAEAVAAAQLLDLQSQGTTATANFNVSSNSNNSNSNLAPTPPPSSIPALANYARTTAGPPGSNIIFVQKSMPAAVGTVPAPIMVNSTNLGGLQQVPFKGAVSGPRTVIVRRTPTAGGPGNVIFVDLPKNQLLSTAQFPQLIQGARFINTQTTTLLNPPVAVASACNAPRKVVNILPQQNTGTRRFQVATSAPALIQPRTGVAIKPLTNIRPLTTTGANSNPPMLKVIMPANNTSAGGGSQSQPPPLQMVQRLVKAVPVPNPTVTVDNSQNAFLYANVQNNDLSEIKISNVMSESSAQAVTILGDGSSQTVGPGEDIFQLALKSSGIDFSGSQIYVTESNPAGMEHHQIILTDSNAQEDVQYITQYSGMASGEAGLSSQSLPVPMEVVASTAIESTHNS